MSQDFAEMRCATCGGPLTSRNRILLFVVGLAMWFLGAELIHLRFVWGFAVLLFLAGAYLIVWATIARGLWCRQCKSFGRNS